MYILLCASMHVIIAVRLLPIQTCWQFYAITDCGLICLVHEANGVRCKNADCFNGGTYFILGIKILNYFCL